MKKSSLTISITIVLSVIMIFLVAMLQFYGQSKISQQCSYLDPIYIDILAFFAGLFLVIEGFISIISKNDDSLIKQSSRIIRVLLGFSIITLHIIQFIHK
jgi:hypothetical protein